MAEQQLELLKQVYQFVDSMVPRADVDNKEMGLLWHGWALREAFLAGAAAEREACAKLANSFETCAACDIEEQPCQVPQIAIAIRARGQD